MTHITELAVFLESHLQDSAERDRADRLAFGIPGMATSASELILVRLILAGRSSLPDSGCHRVLFDIAEKRCLTHDAEFKPEWRPDRTA